MPMGAAKADPTATRLLPLTPQITTAGDSIPPPIKPKNPMSEESATLDPELEGLVTQLDSLSLLQASKLVKHLEERWGVSAAAPVAVAAAGGGGGGEAAEEKTSFDVVLEEAGGQKIQVIKEVRGITGLGLKEAKELVDNPPKPIKEGCSKDEAEEIVKQIEAAGGKAKIA